MTDRAGGPPEFSEPTIVPVGDAAISIRLGNRIALPLVERVRQIAERIRGAALPGVEEVVPGYATLTVFYDPARATCATMIAALTALVRDSLKSPPTAETNRPREHRIPVLYDGPDLTIVAQHTSLSREDVIARHSAPLYTVLLVGFVPGFAYLGELDPALLLPRRGEPRQHVPAGSVAIGGAQTGIYPLETPGGWHLIGRTTAILFDPANVPPARMVPGDRVRFVPVAG